MSDDENSRPGLISAGDPSSGTDRGDSSDLLTNEINEPPNCDSLNGVLIYQVVPEPRESDGRLRRLIAMSIICVVGIIVLAGLVVHSWVSIQTQSTTSMDNFVNGLIETLVPLVTLFVGYLCGKNAKFGKEKSGDEGQ